MFFLLRNVSDLFLPFSSPGHQYRRAWPWCLSHQSANSSAITHSILSYLWLSPLLLCYECMLTTEQLPSTTPKSRGSGCRLFHKLSSYSGVLLCYKQWPLLHMEVSASQGLLGYFQPPHQLPGAPSVACSPDAQYLPMVCYQHSWVAATLRLSKARNLYLPFTSKILIIKLLSSFPLEGRTNNMEEHYDVIWPRSKVPITTSIF